MELNKSHREALIHELGKAKEDLTIQKMCLEKALIATEEGLTNLIPSFEISVFIAQQKIATIDKSLIDNEIDY